MAIHGKNGYFEVGGDEVVGIRSITLSQSVDTADASVMGDTAKTYVEGMTDGTFSIEGVYDSTASTGSDAVLRALIGAGAVEVVAGPEGNANGKAKYTADAILTALNITDPIGDVVAFSAEFQISGAVAKATFSV